LEDIGLCVEFNGLAPPLLLVAVSIPSHSPSRHSLVPFTCPLTPSFPSLVLSLPHSLHLSSHSLVPFTCPLTPSSLPRSLHLSSHSLVPFTCPLTCPLTPLSLPRSLHLASHSLVTFTWPLTPSFPSPVARPLVSPPPLSRVLWCFSDRALERSTLCFYISVFSALSEISLFAFSESCSWVHPNTPVTSCVFVSRAFIVKGKSKRSGSGLRCLLVEVERTNKVRCLESRWWTPLKPEKCSLFYRKN